MSQTSDELTRATWQAVALLKKDAALGWAQYIDIDSSVFRLRVDVDALEQVLPAKGQFHASADIIAARIRAEPRKFLTLERPDGSDDFFWKFAAGQTSSAEVVDFIKHQTPPGIPIRRKDRSPPEIPVSRDDVSPRSFNSKDKGDAAMC